MLLHRGLHRAEPAAGRSTTRGCSPALLGAALLFTGGCNSILGLDPLSEGETSSTTDASSSGSTSTTSSSTATTSTSVTTAAGTGSGGNGTGEGGAGGTGTGGTGGGGGPPGLCETYPFGDGGQVLDNPGFESGIVGWSPQGLIATTVPTDCEGALAIHLVNDGSGDLYQTTAGIAVDQCVEVRFSARSNDGSRIHAVVDSGTNDTFQRHYLAGGDTLPGWQLYEARCKMDQLIEDDTNGVTLDFEPDFETAKSWFELDAVFLSIGECAGGEDSCTPP